MPLDDLSGERICVVRKKKMDRERETVVRVEQEREKSWVRTISRISIESHCGTKCGPHSLFYPGSVKWILEPRAEIRSLLCAYLYHSFSLTLSVAALDNASPGTSLERRGESGRLWHNKSILSSVMDPCLVR